MWFLLLLDLPIKRKVLHFNVVSFGPRHGDSEDRELSLCYIFFKYFGMFVFCFFQQSHEQLLLQVCDKICDLVCSVSTAALMNLGEDVYGRLQTLLAAR